MTEMTYDGRKVSRYERWFPKMCLLGMVLGLGIYLVRKDVGLFWSGYFFGSYLTYKLNKV